MALFPFSPIALYNNLNPKKFTERIQGRGQYETHEAQFTVPQVGVERGQSLQASRIATTCQFGPDQYSTSFPGSLSYSAPMARERGDPGLVWSRVPWTIGIIREGSFDFNILSTIFLSTSKRGYLESRSISIAIRHNVCYVFQ